MQTYTQWKKVSDATEKLMQSWPFAREHFGKLQKYNPVSPPLPTPLRYEQDHVDMDTGEVVNKTMDATLVSYFKTIQQAFRKKHWAAELQIVPRLFVDTQITLTDGERLTDAQYEEILGQPFDHMIHPSKEAYMVMQTKGKAYTQYTTGIFEVVDLRYGLVQKPQFFKHYNRVIIDQIPNGLDVHHLSEGFYGFCLKSCNERLA